MPPTRILVVDDREDLADALAFQFAHRGHLVEIAYSGRDALNREREFEPSIICLDLSLPHPDGYELARRIRARRGARVILVAVTGLDSDPHRRRAEAVGFDGYIVKPATAAQIESLVNPAINDGGSQKPS